MTAFRDLSIRRKLTLIITLVSTSAVLLACLAFLAYDRITFKEAMVQNLKSLSQMIGSNTKAALIFDNADDAAKTLAALKAEQHIVLAAVYRANGQVFVKYHRNQQDFKAPTSPLLNYQFGDNFLDLFHPVLLDNEQIGMIYIRSDLQAMRTRQTRYLVMVSICLVSLCGLVLVITSRLQRVISDPILHLAKVARQVSAKKDYTAHAKRETGGEVGVLIDAFNDMLAEIQRRPGHFIRLSISNMGIGMSKEILAHLFEPFYTTKPRAKAQGWVYLLYTASSSLTRDG